MSRSFSEEVKAEILDNLPKGDCCRHAMAYGLLACADITSDGSVDLRVATHDDAEQIAIFLQNRMACDVEIHEYRIGKISRANLHIALRKRAEWMTWFLDENFQQLQSKLFPCSQCRTHFLRGVFVAQGTVSNPMRAIHLEISCGSDTVAERLSYILCDVGCPPKMTLRENGQHLYYKDSVAVENFLTMLNVNKALFTLINAKIEREIRNNVNRAANCETRNIQKAVIASAKQVEMIQKIRESEHWERLSEPLRVTAQLRLDHPDVTLAELAQLHDPVITKSGLNHRLQKLMQLAGDSKSQPL